jgi:hypothetical protein
MNGTSSVKRIGGVSRAIGRLVLVGSPEKLCLRSSGKPACGGGGWLARGGAPAVGERGGSTLMLPTLRSALGLRCRALPSSLRCGLHADGVRDVDPHLR